MTVSPQAARGTRGPSPTVHVYVASFNTRSATELCVRSMHRYAGHPFRLTVGDSGSTDGSLELLEAFDRNGWLTVERANGRRHHSEWLDLWSRRTDCDFAVFVDSDMEFRRHGWLSELVTAAQEKDASLVYGEWLPAVTSFIEPVGGEEVRLAGRPAPWLLLLDVQRTAALDSSFAFVADRTDAVPEGTIAYDIGAMYFRDATAHGLGVIEMPFTFRRAYHHFGGLSWRGASGGRLASRRLRFAFMKLRLTRLRLASGLTTGPRGRG